MNFVMSFIPVVTIVVLWFVFVYCVLWIVDRIKTVTNMDKDAIGCFDRLTGYDQEDESKITWTVINK